MLEVLIPAVTHFHDKHGVKYSDIDNGAGSPRLMHAAKSLKQIAHQFEVDGDIEKVPAHLRAHLMIEELGEFLDAMANGDHIEMYDGLADLLFVIVGTAVQLNMPFLEECVVEICRSNATKEAGDTQRVRGKGSSYVPPRLEEILRGRLHLPVLLEDLARAQSGEGNAD